MTILVVYESMFGATRAVAEAIAAGLEAAGPVRLVEVTELVDGPAHGAVPDDLTLLVVGGPTHAFGMSRAGTRRDAERKYGTVISRTGVREWLETVTLPSGIAVAAFGTKLSSPLAGSAARKIGQQLRKRGGALVAPARDFVVLGATEGLANGQLDAARAWAGTLAVAPAR